MTRVQSALRHRGPCQKEIDMITEILAVIFSNQFFLVLQLNVLSIELIITLISHPHF